MTIKEVEQILGIPRATVRFYEKQGLIAPGREGNGYREYSAEDVQKLKQIIILRKLGISVADIEDIMDGRKALSEAVTENITNLEKQLNELKGALSMCRLLQKNAAELDTLDVDTCWQTMEEEERKGNTFPDIARDVAHFEKATILEYFGLADINGNLAVSIPKAIGSVGMTMVLSGCVVCLMEGKWSVENLVRGINGICAILLVECVLGLPVYLLSGKYPVIKKHRVEILVGVCLLLCVLLLVLASIFGL